MRARLPSVLAAALAAVLVGLVLLPFAAWADGDPASDVLLGQSVFYPYSPPVSASLARTLDAATAAAKRSGFPIKVALIGSAVDLGVVPDLFGRPQRYAAFLDQEISFNVKQPVLVVMPAGLGGSGLGGGATAALASLPRPASAHPSDLARRAIQAVPKLAAAAGHPIRGVAGSSSGGSANGTSGSTGVLVFLIPLALLVAAALIVTVRARRSDRAG